MMVVKIDIFRNLDQMKASRLILVYLFIFSTTKIQINKTRKADKVPRPVPYRTNDHFGSLSGIERVSPNHAPKSGATLENENL